MDKTQFLIFEIGPGCNLGKLHAKCPNLHPERYAHVDTTQSLTPRGIVKLASRMHHEFGFEGRIGFHYYNEPMLYQRAMFGVMKGIRREVPRARFILWTNGTIPIQNNPHDLGRFDQIFITDYGNDNTQFVSQARQYNNHVQVNQWPLDDRLNMQGRSRLTPCRRMFTEFIIDYHGNVHLCCYDWRGLGTPGNVLRDDLGRVVDRWQSIREAISGQRMSREAPDVCLKCTMRPNKAPDAKKCYGISDFAPGMKQRAVEEVERIILDAYPKAKRPAVVFVAYEGPGDNWRLRMRMYEHLSWNEALYEEHRPRVYVVTDREYDLPSYAKCIVMPHDELPVVNGEPRFSLTRTKNLGILAAIGDGADVIVSTDVDIVFPRETWLRIMKARPGEAVAPKYVMSPSYDERRSGPYDMGCTGTVAMQRKWWRRIRYSESCIGYGADDGILLRAIRARNVAIVRDCDVWHIAHPGASGPRKPGHGSEDCWGRKTGFNFDNFRANQKAGDAKA